MAVTRSAVAESIRRVTEPFTQAIEPVRVSLLYRLGLIMVAVAMVLLPLIYLALIALVGWGLFWHTTQNIAIFDAVGSGSGSTRLAVFGYVTPIVVGAILVLFMIKPIFARRPKPTTPISLDPTRETELFAFVERLCAAVGAPTPSRVDVDHQVNASAGFRRGILSALHHDLVLTIGLPLVAGLTLRQFAGVLAHEFGHFAQGTGMRVTYLIRSVNHWFARVVYERDAWDLRLEQWAERTDWRVAIVLQIARFFVWLTRRVLWTLMMAGHVISCFMLRHMEFDADRYEARIAGSDAFESTVYRLQELGVASQQALATLQVSWRAGQLADDLPALIRVNVDRFPDRAGAAIREHVNTQRTGALDTHPADGDRIASARREDSAGVFHLRDPATIVFRNFDELSRRVTLAFYRQQLDRDVPDSHFVPALTLVEGQQDRDSSAQILSRYLNGAVSMNPQVWLAPQTRLDPLDDQRAGYRELVESRRLVESAAGETLLRAERYRTLDRDAIRVGQALHLLEAGYEIPPEQFGLSSANPDDARRTLELILSNRLATAEDGIDFRSAVQRRMTLALRLIHHPRARERLEAADDVVTRARRLLEVLKCLQSVSGMLDEFHRTFASFSMVLQVLQRNESSDKVMAHLRSMSGDLVGWLRRLEQECDVAYPFDGGGQALTVGRHAIEEVPALDDIGTVHARCEEAIGRLYTLYEQTLSALVGIAARVEGALGLPPLPDIEAIEQRTAAADTTAVPRK